MSVWHHADEPKETNRSSRKVARRCLFEGTRSDLGWADCDSQGSQVLKTDKRLVLADVHDAHPLAQLPQLLADEGLERRVQFLHHLVVELHHLLVVFELQQTLAEVQSQRKTHFLQRVPVLARPIHLKSTKRGRGGRESIC
ncbi:hypothetical protein EYF80_017020 [Liparis tanakae]|uniref:Uncharacterized protein n=1 Tax=Liparis tanakae TaxID=230148 RepID=A0A4Z2I3T4_9TELE|nr:hypothetical protein EYF80_017020 [Liparis tanakae]